MSAALAFGVFALNLVLLACSALLPSATDTACMVGGEVWNIPAWTCGTPIQTLLEAGFNLFNLDGGFLEILKTKVVGTIGLVRTLFEFAVVNYELLEQQGTIMGSLGLLVKGAAMVASIAAFVLLLAGFRN